jgi:NTP pyrophosphatase (non-canonical NTP hydrolase)
MKSKKQEKMYYLYHIPGKKIGMTSNIYSRVIKQQGYKTGEFEVLESSTDVNIIENLEKVYQKRYGYKNDLNSYTDAKNSPINQFKSNKPMYTNVTAQTTTFPVPIKDLENYLTKGIGTTFETNYAKYTVDKSLIETIVNNARESMFRNTACYVYNKVLFEETNKPVPVKKEKPQQAYVDSNNVYDLIRQWASERGIYKNGDSKTQFIKLQEETGELARAILKNDRNELIDAIGDAVVVLTNLAALEGLKIEDCITSAYDVIKSRQGSMVNGTFVKERPVLITKSRYDVTNTL